jgi:regulator of sigma D
MNNSITPIEFLSQQIARVLSYPSTSHTQVYGAILERVEGEAARKQAHARAWELARQQGVEPIRSIKDLQGDFWPEEESVDEFLEWVRAIRQQDNIGVRSEE